MKLRSNAVLAAHMEAAGVSQADLARAADRSRQFIHLLVKGTKNTCSPKVGDRIEKALRVPTGTLFLTEESPVKRPTVAPRKTGRAA